MRLLLFRLFFQCLLPLALSTLSLHDALPIWRLRLYAQGVYPLVPAPHEGSHFEILVRQLGDDGQLHSPVRIIQAAENIGRSEEHTSELQSLRHLVCRLLLEKKKKNT